MTLEEVNAEIEHVTNRMAELKEQLLVADGCLQAFQYMKMKMGPQKVDDLPEVKK